MNDNNSQWRTIFYEGGEVPLVEILRTFADAWALAQPYPDPVGPRWSFLARANAKAHFEAGGGPLTVCWVEGNPQTYTVIERF